MPVLNQQNLVSLSLNDYVKLFKKTTLSYYRQVFQQFVSPLMSRCNVSACCTARPTLSIVSDTLYDETIEIRDEKH